MMTDEQIRLWIKHRNEEYREGSLEAWKKTGIDKIAGWRWLSARAQRPLTEWVTLAEKIAHDNGGRLPEQVFLRQQGYGCLVRAIIRVPSAFSHIKQLRKYKTIEEHLFEAEHLTQHNGGYLPISSKLSSDLKNALRKSPEVFAHLPKDTLRHTHEDNLMLAQGIAKSNGGLLPSCAELAKLDGGQRILGSMRKSPALFCSLIQKKYKNSPLYWVPLAERLCQSNGGYLPGQGFIVAQGHAGLSHALYRHPRIFAHLPRAVYRGSKLVGFFNGSAAQRRVLEIRHGLLPDSRKRAA